MWILVPFLIQLPLSPEPVPIWQTAAFWAAIAAIASAMVAGVNLWITIANRLPKIEVTAFSPYGGSLRFRFVNLRPVPMSVRRINAHTGENVSEVWEASSASEGQDVIAFGAVHTIWIADRMMEDPAWYLADHFSVEYSLEGGKLKRVPVPKSLIAARAWRGELLRRLQNNLEGWEILAWPTRILLRDPSNRGTGCQLSFDGPLGSRIEDAVATSIGANFKDEYSESIRRIASALGYLVELVEAADGPRLRWLAPAQGEALIAYQREVRRRIPLPPPTS